MQQIHRTVPKKERMLRAYANHSDPPYGFKGKPYVIEDEICEREITTHNLAMWLYATNTFDWGLRFFGAEKGNEYKKQIATKEALVKIRKMLMEAEITEKKPDTDALQKRLIERLGNITDDCIERVNRFIGYGVTGITLFFDRFVNKYMDERQVAMVRENGPYAFFLECVNETIMAQLGIVRAEMESCGDPRLQEIELDVVIASFYIFMIKDNMIMKKRAEKNANGLGRGLFTFEDNVAYRFIENMRESVEFNDLIAAACLAYGNVNTAALARLYPLYRDYYSRHEFWIRGQRFEVTASPFAEKRIGVPIGNFSLQVRPVERALKAELEGICDPAFEHADGAIATARLTIGKNGWIIEELQSDIATMVRERDLSISKELRGCIENSNVIAMAATAELAQSNGTESLYLATPWRTIQRYYGMHPHKTTTTYFKFPENNGGELVFDDRSELDKVPQHYYRFTVQNLK